MLLGRNPHCSHPFAEALSPMMLAATAGKKVMQIDVGLAPKACKDAWAEVQKQHSDMAVLSAPMQPKRRHWCGQLSLTRC